MAFLTQEQLDALKIEKMIFHVVGPSDDDLVMLEEITPGPFADFFIERLKSTNTGIMFDFVPGSSVLNALTLVRGNRTAFATQSKILAGLFQTQHGKSAVKGVFLLFVLVADAEQYFALVKYDHQTVLSYQIEDRPGGHFPLLQQLQDTFVKSPEALQKSALIRVTEAGGELCVKDRVAPREVTQYFKAFLGAKRRHTTTTLTEKLAEATKKIAKDHPAELTRDARRGLHQRLYDTLQNQQGFDPENAEPFLASVFGPLPEDSGIRRAFERKLRSMNLEGESFDFDREAVRRPPKRRIVTVEGIQVIWDREYEDNVTKEELVGGRTKITITTGGIEEEDDFAERNPR